MYDNSCLGNNCRETAWQVPFCLLTRSAKWSKKQEMLKRKGLETESRKTPELEAATRLKGKGKLQGTLCTLPRDQWHAALLPALSPLPLLRPLLHWPEGQCFVQWQLNCLWHLPTGASMLIWLWNLSAQWARDWIKSLRKRLHWHTPLPVGTRKAVALLTLWLINLMFNSDLQILWRKNTKSEIKRAARWMAGVLKNFTRLTAPTFVPRKSTQEWNFSIITLLFHCDAVLFSQHCPPAPTMKREGYNYTHNWEAASAGEHIQENKSLERLY